MTKKVKCQYLPISRIQNIKVKILRAPFVDTQQLREIVSQRQRAVVL